MTATRLRRPASPSAQRGAALLAIILLAVLGLVAFLLAGFLNENRVQKREQEAQVQLAQARDALVAFATRQWCVNPVAGESPQWQLPCPAGATDDGASAAGCAVNATVSGRLPWRTLATGDLRDEAGECFWYQREPSQVAAPTGPPWPVVARVIAPGEPVGGQTRPGQQNAVCGNHPTQGDYLEAAADPDRNDIVLEITYQALRAAEIACPPPACTSNAQALLANISGNSNNCRVMPGNTPSPACQNAANALASNSCTCAPEANVFINPPCINNLNPPQCQAAISALQSCS